MRSTEENQEIRSFFQALVERDREIEIPDFPEATKTKAINWWIPVGIAASLIVGVFLLEPRDPESTPINTGEVVIITLEKGPDEELQFRIEETTEMDIWESPTASLLTDF